LTGRGANAQDARRAGCPAFGWPWLPPTRRERPLETHDVHELGIATEVHRLGRKQLEGVPGARIESVIVAVGELSAVEPELLRFAWEAVVAGTPDAGATCVVEWRPARQWCDGCGAIAERAPGSWLRLCPRCGRPLRIEGGDELDLLRVHYRTDVPGEVRA